MAEGRGSIPALRIVTMTTGIQIYAARLPGEAPWRHSHYPSRAPICSDLFEYGDGLATLWHTDATIINIEHDMEFSDDLVSQLVECEHPLCAHAYRMHIPHDYYAHGWLPRDEASRNEGSSIRWIDKGEEWADYSAVGFVKITPEARRFPLAENIPWLALECEVNAAIAGGRWHIHWPEIEHYHYRS